MTFLRFLLLTFTLTLTSMAASPTLQVFFGTYTPAGGASRGIYTAQLDLATGALSEPVVAAEASTNPTFLAWQPGGRTLFALSAATTPAGATAGALASYRFDPAKGSLAFQNFRTTGGGPLAHVNVDRTGRVAVAISYHAGEVASFPLEADGSLGLCAGLLKTTGALGPNPRRQEKPHAHSATFSPDNRFVYVCDLGLDRIFRYQLDPHRGADTRGRNRRRPRRRSASQQVFVGRKILLRDQ
ncbi:MAG: beta-propeller fold lactonase family protein [Lacunisphaera sp.]